MKTSITICTLFLAASTLAFADGVKFSKAYIIPNESGENTVSMGGIEVADKAYRVDFALNENLALEVKNYSLVSNTSEQLMQDLRSTTWTGSYVLRGYSFDTTLNLNIVEDAYVGAEIEHINASGKDSGYFKGRVTGDIVTQYKINDEYIDEDRLSSEELSEITSSTPHKQLIRIKRVRAFEYIKVDGSGDWSTNREYRLTLENGALVGVVGIPNDNYGSNDGTEDNGSLTLSEMGNNRKKAQNVLIADDDAIVDVNPEEISF